MITRKELNDQMADNNAKIKDLQAQNDLLLKQSLMISDEKQWYTEEEEDYRPDRRLKKSIKRLVGRINWIGKFMDTDTGNVIEVERSRIVKVNGEWQV